MPRALTNPLPDYSFFMTCLNIPPGALSRLELTASVPELLSKVVFRRLIQAAV